MKKLTLIYSMYVAIAIFASCKKADPVCTAICKNGGAVTSTCGCNCPAGFTGSQCELAIAAAIPPNRPTSASFQAASLTELRLNRIKGDKEFDGNGPDVTVKVNLDIRNENREVWATVHVTMVETSGDRSTGDRNYEFKLWNCPAGKRIVSITSQTAQSFNYRDIDTKHDNFDFSVSNIMRHLDCVGDTAGDDLDLTDIESTGHLHSLSFNPIGVLLVNE